MAAAIPFIPAIISGIGAISGMMGAGEEKGVGEENARLRERETEIAAGRLEDQQRLNLSSAKARSAASGIRSDTGSQALFVSSLKSNQAQELRELKEAGASQAEIERRTASAKSKGGFGSAFAGFGSAISQGISAMG